MEDINCFLTLIVAPLVGFVGMYSGGFWGVGCGWLIIPSMLFFFDCTPMQAAGIGLLQMAPSIIGTVYRETPSIGWTQNSIGRKLVLPMALGSFITSLIGRSINVFFNELCGSTALLTGFGLFMLFVGVQTLWDKGQKYNSETPLTFSRFAQVWAFVGGLGAGVFSSVLGVGGAMVFRPALASGFKVSELDTARCVRFLLLTTTLVGGLNYLFNSENGFDSKIIILSIAIALGGSIGFPLGARAHEIVVKAGFARMAQRSFAFICAIVCINSALGVLGLIATCRYIMFIAALFLLLFLNVWTRYAKKRLHDKE